jgi:cystathionine beta-lyase/cystathionine gamma-synthase
LLSHPLVSEVYYPGLASDPSHEIAKLQFTGFGGIVSFRLKNGGVREVLGATKIFSLAESLGGVESLIEHPATMSHASMTPELREGAGITENLIRLSIGIEHVEDLIADLDAALATIAKPEAVKEVTATC